MQPSEPDVLIVGGGIAGLATAGFLDRRGRAPLVVEQSAEWRGGYGIGLWSDGLDVLADLGVLEAARAEATEPAGFEIRASGGRSLARASLPAGESPLLVIHRDELHAALRASVPDDRVRMGTAVDSVDPGPDGVAVGFDDGTVDDFDLVVGADGVHSTVRAQCFDDWTRRERDTYVWSLWAPQDVDVGPDLVSVWGPGSEGFVARVGDRVGFNLGARLDAPPEPPARETLRATAEAIGWRLPDLLDGTDEEPFFDRVREVSCDNWHADRVVLVGDAAHAVHPISGMGASLALQDARVLARELSTVRPGGVAAALDRYETRRRPDARRVQRAARFEAAITFLESARLRRVRNGVVRHTPLLDRFVRRRLVG